MTSLHGQVSWVTGSRYFSTRPPRRNSIVSPSSPASVRGGDAENSELEILSDRESPGGIACMGKIAAYVLLKLFIGGKERCNTI